MNKVEILNALLSYRKIRRKRWTTSGYAQLQKGGDETVHNEDGYSLAYSVPHLLVLIANYDDWELFEEKKDSLTWEELIPGLHAGSLSDSNWWISYYIKEYHDNRFILVYCPKPLVRGTTAPQEELIIIRCSLKRAQESAEKHYKENN